MTSVPLSLGPCLLDRLASDDRDRLWPMLTPVTLELDQVLYQAGQDVTHVVFPVTAQIEEVLPQPGGGAVVLRRIDAQAMAGSCVLGDPLTARTARVRVPGQAYRMAYADYAQALDEVRGFRELVLQDAAASLLDSDRQRES